MKKYWFVFAIVVVIAGILVVVTRPPANTTRTDAYSTDDTAPIAGSSGTAAESNSNLSTPSTSTQKTMEKPTMQIDPKKKYTAILHTTAGDIAIEFDTTNTPITANNFISLARAKFYDNTIFHRAIDGFMIQGGDPEGTGSGGPGYRFDDEYLKGTYARGTIAMANAGPNTNGSQFFIMHKDYPLPNAYVIFGKVVSGIEAVDKIATAEVGVAFGGERSKPVSPVKITSVEIQEK